MWWCGHNVQGGHQNVNIGASSVANTQRQRVGWPTEAGWLAGIGKVTLVLVVADVVDDQVHPYCVPKLLWLRVALHISHATAVVISLLQG